MARLAFKPDSSFFRKIVVGAVGARAVCHDLAQHGHRFVELERGSTNSKLWKDVKRKRVRIPDLLCLNCGTRVECRAKTKAELAMSHSPADAERAWDFGMVDRDWIAFPICKPVKELNWTSGNLWHGKSYWREKSWADWRANGYINYFTVGAFRSRLHARSRTKGVVEGLENVIAWDATFSTRNGPVLAVHEEEGKVKIALSDGSRPYSWKAKPGSSIFVSMGDTVEENQVIASTVPPVTGEELACSGALPQGQISKLVSSRERTQRFTGVKLARLRGETDCESDIQQLANDEEEDIYVRLEANSYLVACCEHSPKRTFLSYLESSDPQTQLEAVIALGETGTSETVGLLSAILGNRYQPYFLRSAAAWSLGQIGSDEASAELVSAFSSVDVDLRYQALENLVTIGGSARTVLLGGLRASDERIAAGCAEALRQQQLSPEVIQILVDEIRSGQPNKWMVWLAAHLPREHFNTAIAEVQQHRPELHYAISLLWSFVESWIARHWQLDASGNPLED